jgi:hypothetical protein
LRQEGDVTRGTPLRITIGKALLAGELGDENMPADFADKGANLKTDPVPVPDIVSASSARFSTSDFLFTGGSG